MCVCVLNLWIYLRMHWRIEKKFYFKKDREREREKEAEKNYTLIKSNIISLYAETERQRSGYDVLKLKSEIEKKCAIFDDDVYANLKL